MKDYYSLLRVAPDASLAQIDAAYRRMMQRHHPNARSSPVALERMRELNEAWRVLSDPAQRALYDQSRMDGGAYQPPTPPPTLRNIPQANLADFGARRSSGGTCLVGIAVAVVLVFAVGILLWGLNQQMNFGEMFERTVDEFAALLPTRQVKETEVAEVEATATPDPRCRDGCETPPPGCIVKGDVEADGTHFFYLPNDEGYSRVNVDISAGDRWFCAMANAQAAGWLRKAPTETPTLPPPPEAFTTNTPRRAYIICADNVPLYKGPGDEFPVAQTIPNASRVFVTGVNGEWSVVSGDSGTLYVRTNLLCMPPTRVVPPTSAAQGDAPSTTPLAATIAVAATTNFKYPAPLIGRPTNGETYSCKRPLILEWNLDAPSLGGDEYFLVESKLVEHDTWIALADWTKDLTVTLNPNKGDDGCETVWWSNTGVYEWRVSVVTGNKELPTYLSPFSERFRINYTH